MNTMNIVKIGGNLINDSDVLADFLAQFAQLTAPKILVHGGGAAASEMAKSLGVPVKMTEGRRITDAETLDIITMVYAGKINKNLVATLQKEGCNAIGLCGADANCMVAVKRPIASIDFGFVGDVTQVNISTINTLVQAGLTPVFCAITHNAEGQLLNTNADTIASELAIALSNEYKVRLHYCFEKAGVLQNINDDASVIAHIDSSLFNDLSKQGVISEGMLPKLSNCFYALKNGVSAVHVGNPSMLFDPQSIHTTLEL